MKREEKKWKWRKKTISRLVVGRIRSFGFEACDQRRILFIRTNVQSATMFSFFFLHWFTIFLLCSLLLYRRVCHSAGCILYGTNLHTAKLNTVIRCALRQETRDTSIKLMAKWFSCIGIPYYLNNRFIHMNLLHFRIVPYAICVNVSKLFFFHL